MGPDNTTWKFSRGGRFGGPVSAGALLSMIDGAQLGPDDLVWNAALGSWQPVSDAVAAVRAMAAAPAADGPAAVPAAPPPVVAAPATVAPPPPSPDPAPLRPPVSAGGADLWKYSRQGRITTGVPASEVARMADAGELSGDDLVWSSALGSWQPLSAAPEALRKAVEAERVEAERVEAERLEAEQVAAEQARLAAAAAATPPPNDVPAPEMLSGADIPEMAWPGAWSAGNAAPVPPAAPPPVPPPPVFPPSRAFAAPPLPPPQQPPPPQALAAPPPAGEASDNVEFTYEPDDGSSPAPPPVAKGPFGPLAWVFAGMGVVVILIVAAFAAFVRPGGESASAVPPASSATGPATGPAVATRPARPIASPPAVRPATRAAVAVYPTQPAARSPSASAPAAAALPVTKPAADPPRSPAEAPVIVRTPSPSPAPVPAVEAPPDPEATAWTFLLPSIPRSDRKHAVFAEVATSRGVPLPPAVPGGPKYQWRRASAATAGEAVAGLELAAQDPGTLGWKSALVVRVDPAESTVTLTADPNALPAEPVECHLVDARGRVVARVRVAGFGAVPELAALRAAAVASNAADAAAAAADDEAKRLSGQRDAALAKRQELEDGYERARVRRATSAMGALRQKLADQDELIATLTGDARRASAASAAARREQRSRQEAFERALDACAVPPPNRP